MDDIIYFLLLVGWLAFSFYQQNAKKKKKLEQMRAEEAGQQQNAEAGQSDEMAMEGRQESMQWPEPEQKPGFKSTLEEWLLGEDHSLDKTPENEAQSIETIPETPDYRNRDDRFSAGPKANVYQDYYDRELTENASIGFNADPEKIEDKIEELEEEMVLEENESLEEPKAEGQSGFDLRAAVIYSEILNRRY